MPNSAGLCPPSTKWSVQVSAGFDLQANTLMTTLKDGCHVDQGAGASASKVHTYMRQLRVVVLNLREKLDRINEEIKSLLKIREGLARSLDQLNIELSSNRQEAVLKRPRLVKNRARDTMVSLWERGSDTVRLDRTKMLVAQSKLRTQYKVVREQLQKMGKIRNKLSNTIFEKARVLDMCPDIIAATNRCRHHIKDARKTMEQQTMLQYAGNRGGLQKQRSYLSKKEEHGVSRKSVQPENKHVVEVKGSNSCLVCTKDSTGVPTQVPISKSSNSFGRKETTSPCSAANAVLPRKPIRAWETKDPPKCLCDITNGSLPPPMSSDCISVMKDLAECRRNAKQLRRATQQIVEDCFLVPPVPEETCRENQHGVFYGVACGGRSHRKKRDV